MLTTPISKYTRDNMKHDLAHSAATQKETKEERHQRRVLAFALVFSLCVFAFVGAMILRYHPAGIERDGHGNIVLATTIGHGRVIPEDSISIVTMPQDLMTHLIRTNGASYGKVRYGHFKNTETNTKMFLYLTGKADTVCFKYKGLYYVTDDWRK